MKHLNINVNKDDMEIFNGAEELSPHMPFPSLQCPLLNHIREGKFRSDNEIVQ